MSTRLELLNVQAKKAAALASMAFLMVAATASAAQASSGGGAEKEGISAQACSSTGGGTWCHGTGVAGNGLKNCYSNYVHPSNYHSSTAILGAWVDKRYATAGNWSQAYAENGHIHTCYTYWNNDA